MGKMIILAVSSPGVPLIVCEKPMPNTRSSIVRMALMAELFKINNIL